MVEAGYTLAQISDKALLEKADGIIGELLAAAEEFKAKLLKEPLIIRIRYALAGIAGLQLGNVESRPDETDGLGRAAFAVKVHHSYLTMLCALHRAFGTYDRNKGFANGFAYEVRLREDHATHIVLFVPHDFAPFEP